MKSLKFESQYVSQILSGEKTSTWRLFDDKDLKIHDSLALVDRDSGEVFAKAVIVRIREMELQNVRDSDYDNTHHKPASKEELYESYRKSYGLKVAPDSILKIIDFDLLKA